MICETVSFREAWVMVDPKNDGNAHDTKEEKVEGGLPWESPRRNAPAP